MLYITGSDEYRENDLNKISVVGCEKFNIANFL